MTNAQGSDLTRSEGIALDSLPKWLRDLIDINNEMAGRDTGRAKRFITSADAEGPGSEKEKSERHFNTLMRLLQDPAYAELYGNAVSAVDDAGVAAAQALAKLDQEAGEANQRLNDLKDNAAELPDGRKVFRGEDGRLYAEDGTDVTDQRDSVRGLSANTPGWEEFKRARDARDDVERRRREVEDYIRDVLDPARRRLGDPNNPPSKDELEDIIRHTRDKMPPSVKAQLPESGPSGPAASAGLPADVSAPPVNSAAADEYVPAAGVKAPPLFAQFSAASSVVADQFAPQPGGPKPA